MYYMPHKKKSKLKKVNVNPYYNKIMTKMLSKIDRKKLNKEELQMLNKLLKNMYQLCEFHHNNNI